MQNNKFKIEQKQREYDSLKPVNMSNLAPRQGYYLIMNIAKQVIAGVDCRIARCLWKRNEGDHFELDFHVTIQLHSFEGNHSKGPKHKLQTNLLKSIIHVMDAKVKVVNQERVFYVEWDLLNNLTSFSSGTIEETEIDLELAEAVALSTDIDIQLMEAINSQIDMNDEVMQAILQQEDNAFDEYESTNDLIYALQAQDLPDNKKRNQLSRYGNDTSI